MTEFLWENVDEGLKRFRGVGLLELYVYKS